MDGNALQFIMAGFIDEQRKYKDWLKALPQTPEEGIDFSYAGSFRIF